MKNAKFIAAILFNCIVGFLIATFFHFNPIIGAVGVNALGVAMGYTKHKNGASFFEGLAAEVWIADVLENPYPDSSFLQGATDMSALVDADAINLAEAGVDPDVLVDNTIYPIAETDASDLPIKVALKTYDTTSSVVRNAIQVELKYNQYQLYLNKHKKALAKKIGMDAAYMYAPTQADSSKNNIVLNLGATDSVIDAIIDAQRQYSEADKIEDLNLVLCPAHMAAIYKEDKLLYKALIAKPGEEYYGFRIWSYSKTPYYIGATGVKAAAGVAFDAATHKKSSLIFAKDEVMVADGTADFFYQLKSPSHKGDVFNFQKRALATSLRGKFGGAIIQ